MQQIILYLGNSDLDQTIRQSIEEWHVYHSSLVVDLRSIHRNPTDAVRLGITDLPALVINNTLIAQGKLENWILPLLEHLFTPGKTDL